MLRIGPLCLILAALGSCSERAATPRNLLLVSLDTLRADALGCYGNERGTSPFLDAFAAEGVRFENAYSHTPKTAPAHMSLFTGLEPRVHGLGNFGTAGDQRLSEDVKTLPEVLAAAGFVNVAVTSGGNVKGVLGFERGFEAYDDLGRRADEKLPLLTQWLEQTDDTGQRWFAFFHTYQVHDPYLPPDPWRSQFADPDYDGPVIGDNDLLRELIRSGDSYAEAGARGRDRIYPNFWGRVRRDDPADWQALENLYLAQVAWTDHDVGRAIGRWRSKGWLDDTLVVITSDHGESFGEHGMLQHHQLWNELLHVPLLLQHPAGLGAGREIRAHVRHIDFLPSVLELLGVEDLPVERSGESWAGWLEREPADDVREVFGEHRSAHESALDLWSLRTPEFALVHEREGTSLVQRELDPGDLSPVPLAELTGSLAARAEELAVRAAELRAEQAARALQYRRQAGGELDEAMRAELEALGYLQPED